MTKTPRSVKVEIALLLAALVVGVPLALWDPCSNAVSQQCVEFPPAVARGMNAIGIWCQLVGLIVLSFELLRGPLALQQLTEYEQLSNDLSADFSNALGTPDTHSRVKNVAAHMERRAWLDRTYFSVRNFSLTSRRICTFGLVVAAFGYILQLAAA